MTKLFIKLLCLSVCLLTTNHLAAQYDAEILGVRLIVETPASIQGYKDFTYSSNPSGTGPWGAPITPRVHEEVVKPSDTEACGTVTGVAGKWALILRGNCEFGAKALHAQQAGAIGVIIYNHTPDELVNMGAGASGASVNIPVLFVTKKDGEDMRNEINNGQQVFISISPWGFAKNNDLAIVGGSAAPSPGMAIPKYQLDGSDAPAYKGYIGALVANTGLNNATNVKLNATVSFTSQGGSSTMVHTDSVILPSFPTSDSIHLLSAQNSFKFIPSQTGVYNFNYNVISSANDEFPYDNTTSFDFAITKDVFCRGRYDLNNNRPVITGYTRISGTQTPWTWGPMFFIKKGGYQLKHIQFALTDNDTSKHSLAQSPAGGFIDAYVFKWRDANGDNYIQYNEMELKGTAIKEFTSLDSPRKVLTVDIGDPSSGLPMQIVSEDSAFYWVAINLGVGTTNGFRLGVDEGANYYMRAYAAAREINTSYDYWAPGIMQLRSNISSSDTIRAIPYGVSTAFSARIDSANYLQQSAVPAVSLVTSMWPVSVKDIEKQEFFKIYPNPATDFLRIRMTNSVKKGYIKILDAAARQISITEFEPGTNEASVNVSNLSPGNYYVSIITDGKIYVKPFLKH